MVRKPLRIQSPRQTLLQIHSVPWYSACTCSFSKPFLLSLSLIPSFVSHNICRQNNYQILLYRRLPVEIKRYCKRESGSQQGTETAFHQKVPQECILRKKQQLRAISFSNVSLSSLVILWLASFCFLTFIFPVERSFTSATSSLAEMPYLSKASALLCRCCLLLQHTQHFKRG